MESEKLVQAVALIEQRLATSDGAQISLDSNAPHTMLDVITSADPEVTGVHFDTKDRELHLDAFMNNRSKRKEDHMKVPGVATWSDPDVGDCQCEVKMWLFRDEGSTNVGRVSFSFENQRMNELAQGNQSADWDKLYNAQKKFEDGFRKWYANQVSVVDPDLDGWLQN